jgi:hypothetical protein
MTLDNDSSDARCTHEEWTAFWKIGQIRGIASLEFAGRVSLARELGLLDALLQGDLAMAEKLASEAISTLSAQIRSQYQLTRTHSDRLPVDSGQPGGVESLGQTCMDQASSSLPGVCGNHKVAEGEAGVIPPPQTPSPTGGDRE